MNDKTTDLEFIPSRLFGLLYGITLLTVMSTLTFGSFIKFFDNQNPLYLILVMVFAFIDFIAIQNTIHYISGKVRLTNIGISYQSITESFLIQWTDLKKISISHYTSTGNPHEKRSHTGHIIVWYNGKVQKSINITGLSEIMEIHLANNIEEFAKKYGIEFSRIHLQRDSSFKMMKYAP